VIEAGEMEGALASQGGGFFIYFRKSAIKDSILLQTWKNWHYFPGKKKFPAFPI